MASTTLVSVSEYLRSSYRPDCDFVDGKLEERNPGEHDHAALQAALILWFGHRQEEWNDRGRDFWFSQPFWQGWLVLIRCLPRWPKNIFSATIYI